MNRRSGTVKWYDALRGHGFLTPEAQGDDVFVHSSAVHGTGLVTLSPGDRVEYEVIETPIGPAAEGVVRSR